MRALVLLAVVAVAIASASLCAVRKARRRAGVAAFARAHGFRHSSRDPFGLLYDYNFPLLEMGDRRGCENVVWGEWKGLAFRETDYWYHQEVSSRKPSVGAYRHFNAVVVDVPLYLARVTVEPEGIASVLASGVGRRDIQFESENFNRRFRVRAEDSEFAFKLIDPRMMHWMLSTDEGFGFQFYGSAILVWSRRRRPGDLLPVIGTAKELHDHIPALVWHEYATETRRTGTES